jgi:hypothetical protein
MQIATVAFLFSHVRINSMCITVHRVGTFQRYRNAASGLDAQRCVLLTSTTYSNDRVEIFLCYRQAKQNLVQVCLLRALVISRKSCAMWRFDKSVTPQTVCMEIKTERIIRDVQQANGS